MNISIVAENYRCFNFTLKRTQTPNCAYSKQMEDLTFGNVHRVDLDRSSDYQNATIDYLD